MVWDGCARKGDGANERAQEVQCETRLCGAVDRYATLPVGSAERLASVSRSLYPCTPALGTAWRIPLPRAARGP